MSKIDYISRTAETLCRKYHTRNPYELCDALGIQIHLHDLETEVKAYYFYQSRIRNIVLNTRVQEATRRILLAHELGHDRLHKDIAMLKGFQEVELFDAALPTEYEANIFAAEILIEDKPLLELLNDDDLSFFGVARELGVPAALLDFKFRILKHRGLRIEPLYLANGDFMKKDFDGCWQPTEV